MRVIIYAAAAVLGTWAIFVEGGIFDLVEAVMR
jgi:hypothetical protein